MLENKKIKISILLILALIVLGLLFVYVKPHKNTPTSSGSEDSPTGINYSPSTPEEKQASDDSKTRNLQRDSQPTTPAGAKRSVTAVLASVYINQNGQIEAHGFTGGIIEDGGTCIFTFSSGNKTVTKKTVGFKDASTSQCTPLHIASSELGSGSWSVTLNYSSSAAQGTSNTQILSIE